MPDDSAQLQEFDELVKELKKFPETRTDAAITKLLGFGGSHGDQDLASVRDGSSTKIKIPAAIAKLRDTLMNRSNRNPQLAVASQSSSASTAPAPSQRRGLEPAARSCLVAHAEDDAEAALANAHATQQQQRQATAVIADVEAPSRAIIVDLEAAARDGIVADAKAAQAAAERLVEARVRAFVAAEAAQGARRLRNADTAARVPPLEGVPPELEATPGAGQPRVAPQAMDLIAADEAAARAGIGRLEAEIRDCKVAHAKDARAAAQALSVTRRRNAEIELALAAADARNTELEAARALDARVAAEGRRRAAAAETDAHTARRAVATMARLLEGQVWENAVLQLRLEQAPTMPAEAVVPDVEAVRDASDASPEAPRNTSPATPQHATQLLLPPGHPGWRDPSQPSSVPPEPQDVFHAPRASSTHHAPRSPSAAEVAIIVAQQRSATRGELDPPTPPLAQSTSRARDHSVAAP